MHASANTTHRSALVSKPASAIWNLDTIVERLPLSLMYATGQPLEVELGSGDGSFFIQYARAHPELNLLAVERLLGRLRKLDRKSARAGLKNVRLVRLEAGYVVEYLLPPGSVSAMHVYFPDPWPKRRHHERRLVNPAFVAAACRALKSGGRLYLRTDDTDYCGQMRATCGSNPDLSPTETPADLTAIVTDFERHFVAQGFSINRLAYLRR